MKLTGVPVQIVVADIPRPTQGTTLLLTFIEIVYDSTVCGLAQANEDVIETETRSPSVKEVL